MMICLLITACTDLTNVKNDIKDLQQIVSTLQEAVAALQSAYQNGKIIQSVESVSSGWEIIFTDGSSIYLANGKDGMDGTTPCLYIDPEGYWCISYDNGQSFSKLTDKDGNYFYSKGEEGVSIRVVINDEGYYAYETYLATQPDVVLVTLVTPYSSDPSSIISSIVKDEQNNVITLLMADGTSFAFSLDITYPIGIVLLTNHLSIGQNSVAAFEFRINPSNATFSLDIDCDSPQLELDRVSEVTRVDAPSYVTPPTNYKLIKIERSLNEKGEIKKGQYKAYIQDLGLSADYSENVVLVLSTKDGAGNSIQLSSSLLHVFSGDEGNSFLSFGVLNHKVEVINALGICGEKISVCLPYGTDVTNLKTVFTTNGEKVYVGDIEQESGLTVNDFSSPVTYRVISKQGIAREFEVKIYCFDLPVVYLSTPQQIPIFSKDDWVKESSICIWNIDGTIDNLGSTGVKGRGNSTWKYPKKPYAIKLDKKSKVLGMPKHKRWVLLANWMDRTLMRNHIAFAISKCTKGLAWTPRGEYVELILNGSHVGNYYLCEQIKIDGNRVNIDEMESTDIEEGAITGGYLLEMDMNYDEVNKFRTIIRDLPVNIKDPDEEVLVAKQFDYIRNYLNQVERTLYADNFSLDGHSYTDYIDVNSFIDWWFVHELTLNGEPRWPKSSYMYKGRNGKLFAGPVWDFDWGTFIPDCFSYCINGAIWYNRLFDDPTFVNTVKKKWTETKTLFENVVQEIDNTEVKIRNSDNINIQMWPIDQNTNGDESMEFTEAVDRLRQSYLDRISWLNSAINNL